MKNLLFLLFCLSLISTLLGQVTPNSVQVTAWDEFKSTNDGNWTVEWNSKTGTLSKIWSGQPVKYTGTPVEIAEKFLSENYLIFGMDANLNNLVYMRTLERKGQKHVKFQQTYKSIPIINAEYFVHIRPNGSVDMVNGLYFSGIDLNINPQIDKNTAINIATSNLGNNIVLRHDLESQLVLYPMDGNLYLSWEIIISAKFPLGVWEYYINANSGEIVSKRNIMVSTNGSGNIYPTHPGRSSVTNSTLYRLDSTGNLKGTYADVKNYDGSRAYASNLIFNYSSNSFDFDEVNVYYHIDQYKYNYIKWESSILWHLFL